MGSAAVGRLRLRRPPHTDIQSVKEEGLAGGCPQFSCGNEARCSAAVAAPCASYRHWPTTRKAGHKAASSNSGTGSTGVSKTPIG